MFPVAHLSRRLLVCLPAMGTVTDGAFGSIQSLSSLDLDWRNLG